MSVIGGATIKDFVSRTMDALLGPQLAKRFVWAGRLTEKHAFMKLELRNVMFGVYSTSIVYNYPELDLNIVSSLVSF